MASFYQRQAGNVNDPGAEAERKKPWEKKLFQIIVEFTNQFGYDIPDRRKGVPI